MQLPLLTSSSSTCSSVGVAVQLTVLKAVASLTAPLPLCCTLLPALAGRCGGQAVAAGGIMPAAPAAALQAVRMPRTLAQGNVKHCSPVCVSWVSSCCPLIRVQHQASSQAYCQDCVYAAPPAVERAKRDLWYSIGFVSSTLVQSGCFGELYRSLSELRATR